MYRYKVVFCSMEFSFRNEDRIAELFNSLDLTKGDDKSVLVDPLTKIQNEVGKLSEQKTLSWDDYALHCACLHLLDEAIDWATGSLDLDLDLLDDSFCGVCLTIEECLEPYSPRDNLADLIREADDRRDTDTVKRLKALQTNLEKQGCL